MNVLTLFLAGQAAGGHTLNNTDSPMNTDTKPVIDPEDRDMMKSMLLCRAEADPRYTDQTPMAMAKELVAVFAWLDSLPTMSESASDAIAKAAKH